MKDNDGEIKITMENEEVVKFFKALSNEDRLDMVKLLLKNKVLNASQVEAEFYLEQSTTSHHLQCLAKSRIVQNRKSGRNRLYYVDKDSLGLLLKEINDSLFNQDS